VVAWADAIAVMDAAGVEQAVVIGSSMGGQAALDLTLAHPNRVSGLVLIGTAMRGAPYLDINEGPTAELDTMIESAENASGIDEVNRL
jgi:3-oxoadipate enol-lactonase